MPDKDKNTNKEMTGSALAAAFAEQVEKRRAEKSRFLPALGALRGVLESLQATIPQVGFEILDFNGLRDNNLIIARQEKDSLYGLLSIYDARYVVRLHGDETIVDLHTDNLNKIRSTLHIDDRDFWHDPAYDREYDWYGDDEDEDNEDDECLEGRQFMRFDLEGEARDFCDTVIQTAAACAAIADLKEYDVPAAPQGVKTMRKFLKP